MNQAKTMQGNLLLPDNLFIGSQVRSDYIWKSLITEKRVSLSWVDKIYKGSILYAFWIVLSSSVE